MQNDFVLHWSPMFLVVGFTVSQKMGANLRMKKMWYASQNMTLLGKERGLESFSQSGWSRKIY